MTILSTDFETRSRADLFAVGLEAYAADPSTEVLMQSWKIDDGETHLWLPKDGPMPAELRDAMTDPHVRKHAWNAAFEIAITREVIGIEPTNWRCVMVMAHYASLPGKLEAAGAAIGLSEDQAKLADGKRLIRKFCGPHKPTKKRPGEWHDWDTDPEDWARFCEYCVRDTDTEHTIYHKLSPFQMPEHEWRLWELDQQINRRGLPVDMQLVENAIRIASLEKPRLTRELLRMTGLPKITGAYFLPWAKERGYPFNDLRKDSVNRALNDCDLPEELVEAFRLRTQVGKTSTAKYDTIMESAYEGRVRHAFQFYGAMRTGRWGGRGAQPQNLPRPDGAVEKKLELATNMVRNGEYEDIYFEFGNAMTVLSSCVRSAFRAGPGKKLVVADLNAIENRVLGWMTGCERILDVFREGRCPYIDFATELYSEDYDTLYAEYRAGNKTKRTNAKPAVLGAGYRLGGGDLYTNKNGDVLKGGLWGYAENMGVKMTRKEAHIAVKVFRQRYPEVVQFWYDIQNAFSAAIRDHVTTKVGPLVVDYIPGCVRIRLPSGRHLHYLRPRLEERVIAVVDRDRTKHEDGIPVGEIVYKKIRVEAITYEGQDQTTKQWRRMDTHGGRLTENVDQAISRDILAVGLTRADKAGFATVAHVHDEIITEVECDDLNLSVEKLSELMSAPIPWASGLPLGAEGYENDFYKKD